MGVPHSTGGSTVWLLKQALIMMMTSSVWANPEPKKIEIVITGPGTNLADREGELVAPPGFPEQPFELNATAYIFVLENTMIEGSVQVSMKTFNIHPKSWLNVRKSKYGASTGQLLGRYDITRAPPSVITTDTCCLRLEFEAGCCGPAEDQYTGLRATYKFITTPGKGRRSDCRHDPVHSKLCNGECIHPSWECPCPIYGQFKCNNGECIDHKMVCNGQDNCSDRSDEASCFKDDDTTHDRPTGLGVMFTFSVIITTVLSLLAFVCVIIFIMSTWEKLMIRKKRNKSKCDKGEPPKNPFRQQEEGSDCHFTNHVYKDS